MRTHAAAAYATAILFIFGYPYGYASLTSADEGQSSDDFESNVATVQQYMTNDEGYFNVGAAKADGASDLILEAGKVANQFRGGPSNDPFADQSRTTLKFPVWGNWCGPGISGGKVKDVLDAQCKKHDKCYGRQYGSCKCDRALIRNIKRNKGRMSFGAKVVATGISAYFRLKC